MGFQVRDGNHLMLVNPAHSRTRRTLTIAHEFGHLALGHRPILIKNDVRMRENRYSARHFSARMPSWD